MNSPAQRPDDTLLSAWLDGEVEGADCARIQEITSPSSSVTKNIRSRSARCAIDTIAIRARPSGV